MLCGKLATHLSCLTTLSRTESLFSCTVQLHYRSGSAVLGVCVKRAENTAHEECMERGIMSPSDYERKPRAAEKSRHVILREKMEADKHKTGLW